MRVSHHGLVLQVDGFPSKKIPAGDYDTTDPTEIALLTNLCNAGAIANIID